MCYITVPNPNNLYELLDDIDIDIDAIPDEQIPDLTEDEEQMSYLIEDEESGFIEHDIPENPAENYENDGSTFPEEEHPTIANIFSIIYRTHFFDRNILFEPEPRPRPRQ